MESSQAYYTQAEVADLFQVSSSAVRLWRLAVLIEGKRRGNKWLYSAAEVHRLSEWRAAQEFGTSEGKASQDFARSGIDPSEVEASTPKGGPTDRRAGGDATSNAGGIDADVKSSEDNSTEREQFAALPSVDHSVQLEQMKGKLEALDNEKCHLADHVTTLRTQLEKSEQRHAGELDKLHHIVSELQTTIEQMERTREEERKRTDTMIERRDQRIAELTQERDSHQEQTKVLVVDVDAHEQAVLALQASVSERDEQIDGLTCKTKTYERQVESLATIGGWIRHRWLYQGRKSASR